MLRHRLLIFCVFSVLVSCYSAEDIFLDPGIPHLETPHDKIAFVRTKWLNGKHIETTFLDSQDRALEIFRFGRTNLKELNQYEGANNTLTVNYYHSDSSPTGYVQIDSVRRKFDSTGQMVARLLSGGSNNGGGFSFDPEYRKKQSFTYTETGDTIVKTLMKKSAIPDTTFSSRKEFWEKDDQGHLVYHYKLYVYKGQDGSRDTINHFAQRYAYDSGGKLAMNWFEHMHLGRFYRPEGADTIWYKYDGQNRFVEEVHRYTTDMSNKSEPSTVGLTKFNKESRDRDRKRFLEGDEYFPNNDKTDTVKYKYEVFMPDKHLPLKIPTNL